MVHGTAAEWKVLAIRARHAAVHGTFEEAMQYIDAAMTSCNPKQLHDLNIEKTRILQACSSFDDAREMLQGMISDAVT